MAAFSTERLRRKATTPRHMRIAAPKRPRIAPTQMNTVPSGRVDCLIKGALAIGGGEGGGYVGTELSTVLDRVGILAVVAVLSAGRSVGSADVDVELESLGRDVVVLCALSVVVAAGAALSVVVVFASSAVVSVVAARLTAEKEESARNVESRSERFSDSRVLAISLVTVALRSVVNVFAVVLHKEVLEQRLTAENTIRSCNINKAEWVLR